VPDIWLATCSGLPTGGSEDGPAVDAAFAALGVDARWAVWDDDSVDWASARLVAIRSTWDYDTRHEDFLAWAAKVDALTTLVNPLSVLRWNSVKTYLVELAAAGVPTVPTVEAAGTYVAEVPTVLKPAVGAGGRGVVVVPPGQAVSLSSGIHVAQPLLQSVRTDGEHSVFLLGGEPVAAAVKRPAAGEIRVHEEYGGRTVAAELTDEKVGVSMASLRATEHRFGVPLPYARADLMRLDDGTLVVSELELVEPGLYADVVPEVADAYAAAMCAVLGDTRGAATS
jgi:Prokaryotic glutathione synthetase, ATP-grasp domain